MSADLANHERIHTMKPPPVVQPELLVDRPPLRNRLLAETKNYTGLITIELFGVVFSLWIPNLFLTGTNLRNLLQGQSVAAVLAIGLLLPVASGLFDLSVAATLGLACSSSVWLLLHGYGLALAVVLPILLGALIGVINAIIVVRLHVDAFIGTLGTSSVVGSAGYWITGGNQLVTPRNNGLQRFSVDRILGVPAPMYVLAALAVITWFVLRYRPVGRFLQAIGANERAAFLTGVAVGRIRTGALILGAMIAAAAGVLAAGQLGSASPGMGAPYLLPAFTAVLLGATQVLPGRVNVIGTLIAIYLLAVGVDGLQLAGMPSYINDLFNGIALIAAVAFAVRLRRSART